MPDGVGAEVKYSRDAEEVEKASIKATQLNLPSVATALGERFSLVPGGANLADVVRATGLDRLVMSNVSAEAKITPDFEKRKFELNLVSSLGAPLPLFEKASVQLLASRDDSSDDWGVCTGMAVQGIDVAEVVSTLSGVDVASNVPFRVKADVGLAVATKDTPSAKLIAPLNRVKLPLKDKPGKAGIPKGVAVAQTVRLAAGTC